MRTSNQVMRDPPKNKATELIQSLWILFPAWLGINQQFIIGTYVDQPFSPGFGVAQSQPQYNINPFLTLGQDRTLEILALHFFLLESALEVTNSNQSAWGLASTRTLTSTLWNMCWTSWQMGFTNHFFTGWPQMSSMLALFLWTQNQWQFLNPGWNLTWHHMTSQ